MTETKLMTFNELCVVTSHIEDLAGELKISPLQIVFALLQADILSRPEQVAMGRYMLGEDLSDIYPSTIQS